MYPALHLQSVCKVLPAREEAFESHQEQLAGPKTSLYWLILHAVQMLASAPVNPALHWQEAFVMLPATEVESVGQCVQLGPNPGL